MRASRMLVVVGMLAAAFVGGACMQWLMGSGAAQAAASEPAAKEIRAQAFVLVDAEGKELARLARSTEPSSQGELGYVSLLFFDDKGTKRVVLGVARDGSGSGLGLCHPDGKLAIGLGTGPEGLGLTLRDTKGRERAGVGMPPTAGASFVTKNEKGEDTWRSGEAK